MFDLSFYLMFAAANFLGTIILIPRNLYKKYLLYGLIFGGIGDTIVVSTVHFLGFVNYKNMGVTNIFEIFSFWMPIAWTFYFMVYLYFLPARKIFLVPYVISFAVLNYSVGIVMSQSGFLEIIGVYKYIQPFVFLIWDSISAWAFYKNEHQVLI